MVDTFAVLAFPARRKPVGVDHELDAMLAEGQGGSSDMSVDSEFSDESAR